jgi:phospholipase/carboxylesterase
MALHTSLRLEDKLAGVIGLSGYLPLADMLDHERHPANQPTPIFLAHGTMDPVVTINRAEASRDKLQALGYDVSWHTYPMPHSVSAQEVFDIANYLRQVIV